MTTSIHNENRILLNFKINTFLFKSPNSKIVKEDKIENVDDNRISYVSVQTLIKYSKFTFLNFLIFFNFNLIRDFQ
jgi:hypothetical protein